MNLGMETDDPLPFGNLRWTRMIFSESGNGSGASRTRSITEKIAVFAPMPSARARTATLLKPGLLIRARKEWRKSASRVSTIAYTARRANWFPQKKSPKLYGDRFPAAKMPLRSNQSPPNGVARRTPDCRYWFNQGEATLVKRAWAT